MAEKSTRRQIKDQGRRMVNDFDNAMMRLKAIDELAEGKSVVINTQLPSMFQLLELTQGFVEEFYEKL